MGGGRSRRGGGNNQEKPSAPESSAAAGGGGAGGGSTAVPKKSQPSESPLASLLTALGSGAAAVAAPRHTPPSVTSPVSTAAAAEGTTSSSAAAATAGGSSAIHNAAGVPNWKSYTVHTWRKDNITVVNLRDDSELLHFPSTNEAPRAANPPLVSAAAIHRSPAIATAGAGQAPPPPYKESTPTDSATRHVAALLSGGAAAAGGSIKGSATENPAATGAQNGGAGAASLQVFLNDQLARMREFNKPSSAATGASAPPFAGHGRPNSQPHHASLDVHGAASGRSSATSGTANNTHRAGGHEPGQPHPAATAAKALTSATTNAASVGGSILGSASLLPPPVLTNASTSSRGQSPAPTAVTALFSDPLWAAGASNSKAAATADKDDDESLTVDFLTGILGDLRNEQSSSAAAPAPIASSGESLWKELTPPPQQQLQQQQQQQQQWSVSPLHPAAARAAPTHHIVGTASPAGALPMGTAYVVTAAPNGMGSYVPVTQFVSAAPLQAFGQQQMIALPQGMQLVHHQHHHQQHHHLAAAMPATAAVNQWAVPPRGRPGPKMMSGAPVAASVVAPRQTGPIVMNMQQLHQLGVTAAAAGQPPPQVKYMTLDEFQRMMGQQGQQQPQTFTVAAVQQHSQSSPHPPSPNQLSASTVAGAKPPASPPDAPAAALQTRSTVAATQPTNAGSAASGSRSAASANGVNVSAAPFTPKPGSS